MRITRWLSQIFDPIHFHDLNLEQINAGMQDVDVRRHWVMSVLEEIREINLRTHASLAHGELNEKFLRESGRLQGILWVLHQFSNSKTSVELNRHHNHTENQFEGVAVDPAP